jgi:hypothetical protein
MNHSMMTLLPQCRRDEMWDEVSGRCVCVCVWWVVVRQGIEAEVKEGEKGMPESIK